MDDVHLYLKAIWPLWWPAVSVGSLWGIDEILQRWVPKAKNVLDRFPERHRRRVELAALFLAIFYAGFSVWDDEHRHMVSVTSERDVARGQLAELSNRSAPVSEETLKLIDQLKSDLRTTQVALDTLRRAARLDNHLYQNGKDVAAVAELSVDQAGDTLQVGMLTSQQPFDFRVETEMQKVRMLCDAKSPTTSAAMGANLNLTYYRVTCHYLGPIQ